MKMNLLNRRKFIAAGSIFFLAGCTSSAEADSSGSPKGEDSTTSADATESPSNALINSSQKQSASVVVGELVDGDSISMVARSVKKTTKLGEFQEADSGSTFLVVRFVVKNTSNDFIDFNSFWQTRVKDSENYVYNSSFGSTDHRFDSGYLAPGEVSRGDIVYEIPEDAKGLVLQFDFSAFDFFKFDRVTIDLENEANSAADLTQSLGVDVNTPGKQVSHDEIGVTIHAVRKETELGSFTEADEGHEYVIPDIEITNNTDEPLNVSTLLQMRVKTDTGLSYTADIGGTSSLSKRYSQGSEIAPGESRRGELAYQVPTDARSLYFVFDWYDLADGGHKAFWGL